MDNVGTLDRYDYEAWMNKVLDGLVADYKLSEFAAISVLNHQKTLVNELFNEYTKDASFNLAATLDRLMDNDLENDCYN